MTKTVQYGGPTTSDLDLTQVLWEHVSVPKAGCHIYRFDFYGWIERVVDESFDPVDPKKTYRIWRQPSDTYYKIYKEEYEKLGGK